MFVIGDEVYTKTLEIKKSKFLTIVKNVSSKEEWKIFLKNYKNPKATHNCFAYKIGYQKQSASFDDDGEPSGTAGKQILKIIEKKQLTGIGILVIHHFGGIKLGASRLRRAYVQATIQVLQNVPTFEIQETYFYVINFKVENTKIIDLFLKNKQVIIRGTFYNSSDVQYKLEYSAKNLFKDVNLPILSFSFQKTWTKKRNFLKGGLLFHF